MNAWSQAALPEVLDFREGPGILAKDFVEEGLPLVRLAGLKRGASLLSGCNHLRQEDVAKRWSQFQLEEGDVLLSTSASLGEVATVGPDGVGAVPYTGIIRFRPKDGRIDPAFIPHLLTTHTFKNQVAAMGVGSVMKHFGPTHLKHMTVTFPQVEEQRAIAEVLGALDNKIAANTRIASTSRSLAEAEWLRARMQSSEQVRLRDVATLNYGKSLPAKRRVAGGVQVVGSGGVTGTHNQALVAEAGIVVGRKGTAGAVHWLHGPHFPIDTTFFVTPTAGLTSHFLYYELTSMRLTEMNSDSAVPGLNREEAYAAPVRHPGQSSLRRFNEVVPVLFDLFAQVEAESLSLATTRDALLPLLMSGKVTVTDAETIVEEAL